MQNPVGTIPAVPRDAVKKWCTQVKVNSLQQRGGVGFQGGGVLKSYRSRGSGWWMEKIYGSYMCYQ
jgi:hypothetical protein